MGWGVFVLAWGMFAVSTIDNVIKPLIISRGVDLPFILVLLGVLGGVIAFGFIGVFLGPVLLAIGYALLMEWVAMRGAGAAVQMVAPVDPAEAALSGSTSVPATERERLRTTGARTEEAEETARD